MCHSMMMFGTWHMDMGMGIVHVVRHVCEHIKIYQGFPPYPNVNHQGALFGNPPPCTLLLVYCVEMESHLLGCHHHPPWKN